MARTNGRTTRVVARTGTGTLRVIEQQLPEPGAGEVLIEVHRSLVSPGTELGGGWAALAEERRNPRPLEKPRPIGYSNAGVVAAVGPGVERFAPGDRVAAIGAGYARHADYAVVPVNLVFLLPDGVDFEQGAFAMLAATGLHAMRRTDAGFGESVAVLGLGLLGQLTAQLFQAAGNSVIGWDLIPHRIEIARGWGIHGACLVGEDDPVETCREFTGGFGVDAGVVSIAGEATTAIRDLERSMRVSADGHTTGVITIVGGIHLDYHGETTNIDYRRASRTGPGYHDADWERGREYPPVFVRWNTQTNVRLCLELMARGTLRTDPLVTHRIPFDGCETLIPRLLDDHRQILGLVFQMR